MKLSSWQEPDFSLTSGRVDHSRSSYYRRMLAIPPAYARLATHVGTDQIIWCYARPDEYRKLPGDTRVEWLLDVPDEKILGIIDSWVWERIIGSKAYPSALRNRWAMEAVQGEHDLLAHIRVREDEYLSQPPPEGGWWKALFISDIDTADSIVLVEHPIAESWVIRCGTSAGQATDPCEVAMASGMKVASARPPGSPVPFGYEGP